MHFFATIFAAIFSFAGAQHLRTIEATPASPSPLVYASRMERVEFLAPSERHLLMVAAVLPQRSRYAGGAWHSNAIRHRPTLRLTSFER